MCYVYKNVPSNKCKNTKAYTLNTLLLLKYTVL